MQKKPKFNADLGGFFSDDKPGQPASSQDVDTLATPINPAVPLRAISIRREYRTQRVQLLFKPSLYKALKGLSEASGISLNQLIISIIEEHLDKHKV